MRRLFLTLILPCIGMMGGNMPVVCAKNAQPLYTQFQTAKCDQRVAVYWYWISDNISVEGVERDLEAMKKAGIDRAFIGNIWEGSVRPGGIKVLSPGWWEVLHAALKKATEQDIQNAMATLMKGRTSFVIAHRLSTIRDAAMILYMENGDIKEVGNHETLMAKGGKYADLYNSQFA